MSEGHLDVVISKEDSKFAAMCPAFPECKGVGETEKEALEKLSDAIGVFVGKITKDSMKTLLLSENYTEILMGQKVQQDDQRKIFHLNPALRQTPRSILLRLKPMSELGVAPKKPQQDRHDINEFLRQLESQSIVIPQDIMFGFPLSAN